MVQTQYLPFVRKMLALVQVDKEPLKHPDPHTSAEAVLAFETEIAKMQVSRTKLRDPLATYNKVRNRVKSAALSP